MSELMSTEPKSSHESPSSVQRLLIAVAQLTLCACARQEFSPKLSIGYIQPVRRSDAHICSNRHSSRWPLCTQWTEKAREDESGIYKYQQMRLCCFVLHLLLVVALPSVSRHFTIFTMLFHFFWLRVTLWDKRRGQFESLRWFFFFAQSWYM